MSEAEHPEAVKIIAMYALRIPRPEIRDTNDEPVYCRLRLSSVMGALWMAYLAGENAARQSHEGKAPEHSTDA